MTFTADITIMPHPELLDPQGKAVTHGLRTLDLQAIHDVRIGKHVEMQLEADSEQEALALAEKACKELLANPIMEHYRIALRAAEAAAS
jgi:phosphoribosylformylglycinamidine synthase PurS subunit